MSASSEGGAGGGTVGGGGGSTATAPSGMLNDIQVECICTYILSGINPV